MIEYSTLVSTAIGGIIAISTLWIKEHFDRKREIQNWFEDTYIEEGINPLIHTLSNWCYHIQTIQEIEKANPNFSSWGNYSYLFSNTNVPITQAHSEEELKNISLPAYECELIDDILGETSIWVVIRDTIHLVIIGYANNTAFEYFDELIDNLKDLKEVLYEMKIRKKSDVFKLSDKEEVKSIAEKIDKIITADEIVKDIASSVISRQIPEIS